MSLAHRGQAAGLSLLLGWLSVAACAQASPTTSLSPMPASATQTASRTAESIVRARPTRTPRDDRWPVTLTPTLSPTPVDPLALGLPTAGPLNLADAAASHFVHWFGGRRDSGLLVVRDEDGQVMSTWQPPEGAEIRHLSEALSPDGRYLTWLSGKRPDQHLAAPIDPPLTLHIQDMFTGAERFSQALLHPGILEDLRRQVFTVEGWGDKGWGENGENWTPSWEQPGGFLWPPAMFSSVISGVFDDGIGRTAWSPDSSRLAVVAALDGPTSDLYLLDPSSFEMSRLTHEPEHVTQIDWSPDGRTLIYHAGLEPQYISSDYRATYLVDAVTGADHRFPTAAPQEGGPSGPMTTMLDSSHDSNAEDEWPYGWTRNGQAITGARYNGCVYCGLDRYDPVTGQETAILPGIPPGFDLVPMPWGDWAAVARRDLEEDEGELAPGTHLVHLLSGESQRVDDLPRYMHFWNQAELPFLLVDAVDINDSSSHRQTATPMPPVAVGPGGRRSLIEGFPPEAFVVVSPDGRWRVACNAQICQVYGDGPRPVGAWADPDPRESSHPAWNMIFAPDGGQLVYLSDGVLYLVRMPDGKPQSLGEWAGSWQEYSEGQLSWRADEVSLANGLTWFGRTAR